MTQLSINSHTAVGRMYETRYLSTSIGLECVRGATRWEGRRGGGRGSGSGVGVVNKLGNTLIAHDNEKGANKSNPFACNKQCCVVTGRRGDGATGRRGDGATGRRGDGATGRRGDGATGRG